MQRSLTAVVDREVRFSAADGNIYRLRHRQTATRHRVDISRYSDLHRNKTQDVITNGVVVFCQNVPKLLVSHIGVIFPICLNQVTNNKVMILYLHTIYNHHQTDPPQFWRLRRRRPVIHWPQQRPHRGGGGAPAPGGSGKVGQLQGVPQLSSHFVLIVCCASHASPIIKWSIYFFLWIKIYAKNGIILGWTF